MFNIGDKVQVIQIIDYVFESLIGKTLEDELVGLMGTITDIYEEAEELPNIRVEFEDGNYSWFYTKELEKIKELE